MRIRAYFPCICCFSRFIQTMGEGLSEVGQARAWIHLALEKKMLSQHLKELLTNQELLRSASLSTDFNLAQVSCFWVSFIKCHDSDYFSLSSCAPTGSCINVMHSCSMRKKGSSFCSTCSLSTLWNTSVSHASSPPSVSPVNFNNQSLLADYTLQGHRTFSLWLCLLPTGLI